MKCRLLPSLALCVSLLCSCATQRSVRSGLPSDITLDLDAGRDGLMIVPVRLESGEELPFVVDTGSPYTIFDKSFESRLGNRLQSGTATNFDFEYEMSLYAAPKLFLAGAPLKIDGDGVASLDLSRISTNAGRSIMGLIGMDCLSHYCVQFDFKAGKLHFLNPEQINPAKLGKAYPIDFSSQGQSDASFRTFIHHGSLVGNHGTSLLVDTGCNVDGGLQPQLFQEEVKALKHEMTDDGGANFADCTWEGQTYTNIAVRTWTNSPGGPNLIGLRFLARHLVTFDFPHRTMYLKEMSAGPLPRNAISQRLEATKMSVARSAMDYCTVLKRRGLLPGWSRTDAPGDSTTDFDYHYPDSVVLKARKKGDMAIYHYEVLRATEHSPWKLHRAWRADNQDKVLEEFSVWPWRITENKL